MRNQRVNGVLSRVAEYVDGSSLVEMDVFVEGTNGMCFPFYSHLEKKYEGRPVEYETHSEPDGTFVQKIIGSDFKVIARASGSQRMRIEEKGRKTRVKFMLEESS
jgi:hypothetical protein